MSVAETTLPTPPVPLTPTNWAHALDGAPRLARRALALATGLEYGRLRIRVPDGRSFVIEGQKPGPDAELVINDYRFARALVRGGDAGFAESFFDNQWDSPDVTAFLELFCWNSHLVERLMSERFSTRLLHRALRALTRNTRRGARRNIEAHYDLGNQFYRHWLDASMTYSSALFEGHDLSLEEAQLAKYRALSETLGLEPGDHVLEIGCGWGGFAEYAAGHRGCRVTALTISRKQHEYASQRIAAAGLADRVEVRFQDYRDVSGTFDHIASIEMFEAVGERFWPVYFQQLRDRLRRGGRAALQVITIADEMFDSYRRETDFIQRYVFPGGMLPSPGVLRTLTRDAGLVATACRSFGADYARTLAHWRIRFDAAWPTIERMGFDERFRRLWSYYLSYCEAGFRSRNIDVRQIAFSHR